MNNKVLIKDTRDPLHGYTREQLIQLFKEKLKDRVCEAYFFGSFATNSMHSQSDIDIMLVKQTNTPFVERAFEFADLLDIISTLDILVYTPEEFLKLTTNPTIGFWSDVTKTLKKII